MLNVHRSFLKSVNDEDFLSTLQLGIPYPSLLKEEVRCRSLESLGKEDFVELNVQNIEDVFAAVDDVCFANRISQKRNVQFSFINGKRKGGHFVPRTDTVCEIAINGGMILRSNGRALCNGIECKSRLEILIEILFHEAVHAVVHIYGSRRECPHGKEFLDITRGYFRHTSVNHWITHDTSGMISRSKAVVGQAVFFMHHGDRRDGTILKKNPKTARVIVHDNHKVFYVRYELLKSDH